MIAVKLYEKIYEELKGQILTGDFGGGALLPAEKALQEKYGVSRITVRHAYRLLEEENLILRTPGRGTVLKPSVYKSDKKILGVILCDYRADFGEKLVKSVETEADKCGYRILLARSFDSHENESRALSDFISLGVSGILIQNCRDAFTKNLLKLFVQGFPVVSLDRYSKELLIPSVSSDNFEGGLRAVNYLLHRGHQKILFASPDTNGTSTLKGRLLGFQEAFMQRDLSINSDCLVTDLRSPVEDTPQSRTADVKRLAKAIESTGCTAVLAAEYRILRLCGQAGKLLPKPENLPELVCFDCPDGLSEAAPFAFVRQNEEELGRLAAHKLCDIIDKKDVELRTVVPVKLVLPKRAASFFYLTKLQK